MTDKITYLKYFSVQPHIIVQNQILTENFVLSAFFHLYAAPNLFLKVIFVQRKNKLRRQSKMFNGFFLRINELNNIILKINLAWPGRDCCHAGWAWKIRPVEISSSFSFSYSQPSYTSLTTACNNFDKNCYSIKLSFLLLQNGTYKTVSIFSCRLMHKRDLKLFQSSPPIDNLDWQIRISWRIPEV